MPNWLKNAVFYEIYPQSFQDTNGDGIGDLQGIIQRLDYIAELGCNALWLNPCFDSPFYDAGYDVADYRKIAPRYGTNEDMRRLFAEAHARGIRVLLDLVPGHTSVQHEWFRQSMQAQPNEYTSRYIWADGPWERFEGVAGITGSISGFCDRGTCAVNFYSTQPALNYGFANPDPEKPWQIAADSEAALATRRDIMDIMRFWLGMGCDGFRVDMAHSLVKGDTGYKETIKLWREFRAFLDAEFPDAAMISEWGDPSLSLQAGFHMDFLLHFGPSEYVSLFREKPYFSRSAKGDISLFVQRYLETAEGCKNRGLICIPSSNHDMPRIARRLDEAELKIAFAFLLTMPGAPFIYYGDEIGMRYLEDLPSVEGGYERTGSRTPMQWDKSLNAGFSSAKPEDLYICIDPDPQRPNVAAQMQDPNSLWHEIKRLISLRQQHEALQSEAAIEFVHVKQSACPIIYTRGTGNTAVTVALNPGADAVEVELPALAGQSLLYYVGTQPTLNGGKLHLPAGSAALYSK